MALFGAIGAGLKIAGAGIKSIVNRAREKRAAKKAARAAQKQAEAGALLSKIVMPAQQPAAFENAGAVAGKIDTAASIDAKKVSPVVWVAGAVVVLLLLFVVKKR